MINWAKEVSEKPGKATAKPSDLQPLNRMADPLSYVTTWSRKYIYRGFIFELSISAPIQDHPKFVIVRPIRNKLLNMLDMAHLDMMLPTHHTANPPESDLPLSKQLDSMYKLAIKDINSLDKAIPHEQKSIEIAGRALLKLQHNMKQNKKLEPRRLV